MNRFKTVFRLICVGLVIWSVSAFAVDNRHDVDSSDVLIAKGASFKITQSEFKDVAMAQSPSMINEVASSTEKKMALLDKLINMNLLAAEAKRRGYDKNPEVITVKKNRLATLMHKTIAEQISETAPSEAEARTFYENNYSKYNKPEKIRARHILISDRKKAQTILNQLKRENVSQYQFRQYAREHSEDERTASQGGDLTFLTRTDTDSGPDQAVLDAIFQIPTNGAVYPQLVETNAGYHILMRTGYRKAIDMTFEDARERIEKQMQRQAHKDSVKNALARLQEKYPVTLYEENLKHVVIDLTKTETGPGPASSLSEESHLQ